MNPLARTVIEAAKSPAGRRVIRSAATAAAGLVAKSGGGRVGEWQADRRQRALAYKLARQVHGRLSEAVFVGSERTHLVVWNDDVPLAVFPPVDGDLAERTEIRHVTDADRFDPPPEKARRRR